MVQLLLKVWRLLHTATVDLKLSASIVASIRILQYWLKAPVFKPTEAPWQYPVLSPLVITFTKCVTVMFYK
jgi:hypothetical protein